jgi:hypothetical protein
LTPTANLPLVSLTPGKFATGIADTGGVPLLAKSPRIFEKNQIDHNLIFGGLGKDDS